MRSIYIDKVLTNMPSHWGEVTLKMLMQIENGDNQDELFVFSVLVQKTYKEIVHSTLKEDEVTDAVAFVYTETPKWNLLVVPKVLTINGKRCKLPNVLKVCLGQNIMMSNLLERPLSETLISILAVYFQPVYDGGQFDRERLSDIEQLIEKVPAVEGWAVANFFLRSLPNLNRITNQGYILTKKIP